MNECNLSFSDFSDIYISDMDMRLKKTTMHTKRRIFARFILPSFGRKRLSQVSAKDVREWQNDLLKTDLSPAYLRLIDSELIGIFSYAVRFYDLPGNPCTKAGPICNKPPKNMKFWTIEEYRTFIKGLECYPDAHLAFQILFFTGMRCGELLALTPADIDLSRGIIRINKTYTRQDGLDIITSPKTRKSIREVTIPGFLGNEIASFLTEFHTRDAEVKPPLSGNVPAGEAKLSFDKQRLFPHTKYFLAYYMRLSCRKTGVKVIRLHDLRHSHASYLIDKGVQIGIISERLGHEKVSTTLDTYGHLYPSRQEELAKQMDEWEG